MSRLIFDAIQGKQIEVNSSLLTKAAETINVEHDVVCKLRVTNESTNTFSTDILKHKYNFVHLSLNFNNVTLQYDDQAIMYNRWIWTYEGENGGHQYLFLPNDFGYLSFGILWSYTRTNPIPIDIYATENSSCGILNVGRDADERIGEALGNMTKQIAAQNDMYNSSYWCYMRRVHIDSDVVFFACENSICTMQTMEYKCCKFVLDFLSKERHVECYKHHYHFGVVWWLLPILIGEAFFAYYPLLLASFGSRLRVYSRRRRQHSVKLENVGRVHEEVEEKQSIRLSKHNPPITFWSTICGPLSNCNTEGPVLSRLIRTTIIILPLSLTVTRVLLDYEYAEDLVKEAVSKGALVGFSSMIAGYKLATRYFFHFLGGPFVALPLFIVFCCLLIVGPSNLENVLARGLIEFKGKSSFLFTLSAESKGRLASLRIENTIGYKRLEKTLLSQVLMLLNRKFWKQTFKLFITRFSRKLYPMLKTIMPSPCWVVILGFPLLILYLGFCMVELVFSCIYFAFPVISCFFIFMKAYVKTIQGVFHYSSGIKRLIGYILTIMITLVYMYTWYLYCMIFFDAFWFLTKIVMFTYTGVIAFPKLSYGYLILSFMAIYYILESFGSFQQNYQDLLHISIKACRNVQEKMEEEQVNMSILSGDGIPVDLWNVIVERHRPRRIQVAYTLFQLFVVISVVSISLDLLFRFDKFHDLSLISHVFTVLVICTLPKMVKSMCMTAMCYHQRKKLFWKIKQTIRDYINNEIDYEETDIYVFNYLNEYEELTD